MQFYRTVVYMSCPQTKSLCPATPLTARVWLKENAMPVTPVSTATQSVSKLQGLLSGRKTTPSDALLAIFRSVTAAVTCRRHVNCHACVCIDGQDIGLRTCQIEQLLACLCAGCARTTHTRASLSESHRWEKSSVRNTSKYVLFIFTHITVLLDTELSCVLQNYACLSYQ